MFAAPRCRCAQTSVSPQWLQSAHASVVLPRPCPSVLMVFRGCALSIVGFSDGIANMVFYTRSVPLRSERECGRLAPNQRADAWHALRGDACSGWF